MLVLLYNQTQLYTHTIICCITQHNYIHIYTVFIYIHTQLFCCITQHNYIHIYTVPMNPLDIKPQVIFPIQGTPEEVELHDS